MSYPAIQQPDKAPVVDDDVQAKLAKIMEQAKEREVRKQEEQARFRNELIVRKLVHRYVLLGAYQCKEHVANMEAAATLYAEQEAKLHAARQQQERLVRKRGMSEEMVQVLLRQQESTLQLQIQREMFEQQILATLTKKLIHIRPPCKASRELHNIVRPRIDAAAQKTKQIFADPLDVVQARTPPSHAVSPFGGAFAPPTHPAGVLNVQLPPAAPSRPGAATSAGSAISGTRPKSDDDLLGGIEDLLDEADVATYGGVSSKDAPGAPAIPPAVPGAAPVAQTQLAGADDDSDEEILI